MMTLKATLAAAFLLAAFALPSTARTVFDDIRDSAPLIQTLSDNGP